MFSVVAYFVIFAPIIFMFFVGVRSTIRASRRNTAIKRHAAKLMTGRPALTHAEFASGYFSADDASIAARLREMLSDILIVDVTRIHPDDKLIEDLGFGRVDGLDPNFLELDVEKAFGVRLRPAWRPSITIRDLVGYVAARRHTNSIESTK